MVMILTILFAPGHSLWPTAIHLVLKELKSLVISFLLFEKRIKNFVPVFIIVLFLKRTKKLCCWAYDFELAAS